MKDFSTRRGGETLDKLFRGKVSVLQGRGGYRFSLDAPLLARFVSLRNGDRIADLGSGNGVIALLLAALNPTVRVVGFEIQPAMAERAERNAALNRLRERVTIVRGDIRSIRDFFPAELFDLVVCNPPYRAPKSGRLNPDGERRIARHEVSGGIREFLRAGSYLLRRTGRMAAVFPAARAVDLLETMRREGVEPKRMRLVHSFERAPASLILVEGTKGGKCELEVIGPLVIYDSRRRYTAQARDILGA